MKQFAYFLCIGFILAACSVSEKTQNTPPSSPPAVVQATLATMSPQSTETRTIPETAESLPTDTPTAVPTAEPTSTPQPSPSQAIIDTPTPSGGHFTNLRFFIETHPEWQWSQFPPLTREVFAFWEYAGMSAGDVVRREWYLDGKLWLTREETWDIDTYGQSGTVTNVSIYEHDGDGLQPGQYELWLFLNASLQERATFWVDPAEVAEPQPEPDGQRLAYVVAAGTLVIQEADGSVRELLQATEIAELAWFPDGRHIIYVDLDRSRQQFTIIRVGVEQKSWLVDVATGQQTLLSADGREPLISPDSRYVAFVRGSGYGDACGVDYDLQILALDANRLPQASYYVKDFTGIPSMEDFENYPFDWVWHSETELDVQIHPVCALPEDLEEARRPGIYRLNLETLQAVRLGDLPPD